MANIGTLEWCADKIYEVGIKLGYYEGVADTREISVAEAAGRENLLLLMLDLDTVIDMVGCYKVKDSGAVKVYERAQNIKDKITVILYNK